MRIIAVANQKGGCGKTTTAVNLSAALASLGHRVLLMDLDAQGHAGFGLGVNPDQVTAGLYDVLSPTVSPSRSLLEILILVAPNLHLAPSQIMLAALEQELAGRERRECRLAEVLEPAAGQFDFVVFDCAPGLGILTFNALRAAQELLIPVDPSIYSLHGIGKFMETVLLTERNFDKRFRLHVLPIMFDQRTRLAHEIHEELSRYFEGLLLSTTMRRNVRLSEAAAAGKSIIEFGHDSHGYEDNLRLATELVERGAGDAAQRRPAWLENADTLQAQLARTDQARPILNDQWVPAAKHQDNILVFSNFGARKTSVKDQPASEMLVEPRRQGDKICFVLRHPGCARVQIAGDFNDWKPEPLEVGKDGIWRSMLDLTPGAYRYKYIVDGEWINDPDNQQTVPNPYGGFDSILTVT